MTDPDRGDSLCQREFIDLADDENESTASDDSFTDLTDDDTDGVVWEREPLDGGGSVLVATIGQAPLDLEVVERMLQDLGTESWSE